MTTCKHRKITELRRICSCQTQSGPIICYLNCHRRLFPFQTSQPCVLNVFHSNPRHVKDIPSHRPFKMTYKQNTRSWNVLSIHFNSHCNAGLHVPFQPLPPFSPRFMYKEDNDTYNIQSACYDIYNFYESYNYSTLPVFRKKLKLPFHWNKYLNVIAFVCCRYVT